MTTNDKNKGGRPPIDASLRKTKKIGFNVTEDELAFCKTMGGGEAATYIRRLFDGHVAYLAAITAKSTDSPA